MRCTSLAARLMLLAACSLNGCGGGDTQTAQAPGVGSGGTGSYAAGPVTGLGSIIVNGVRYDVDSATLVNEDAVSAQQADLQIGVVVEVAGGDVVRQPDGSDAAVATSVSYASELIGPVGAIVSSGGRPTSITVLGQPVGVTAQTVLPAVALAQGEDVVVHGLHDASGVLKATRIDRVVSPAFYKLSGRVGSVNPGARTLTIGSVPQTIGYAGGMLPDAASGSAALAVGSRASVRLQTTPLGPNRWTAARVGVRQRAWQEGSAVRLEGLLSDYQQTGVTASGRVDDTRVDFSAVLGQGLALTNGLRVKVKGRLVDGVLIVSSAESEDDSQQREVELHGTVSGLGASGFSLRSLQVSFSPGVVEPGLNLSNGACVEVRGVADNLEQVRATRIRRDNGCR